MFSLYISYIYPYVVYHAFYRISSLSMYVEPNQWFFSLLKQLTNSNLRNTDFQGKLKKKTKILILLQLVIFSFPIVLMHLFQYQIFLNFMFIYVTLTFSALPLLCFLLLWRNIGCASTSPCFSLLFT